MTSNHPNEQSNTLEQARSLLSPYLDGEVTPDERALVEGALARSPELRAELESLRQTVRMVRALPRVPAPRPFTLTQADAGMPAPKEPFFRRGWFRALAGAMVALSAVLVAGILVSLNRGAPPAMEVALAPAAE
ncbi:MAG: hypothetical protein D6796_06715, partial [Caldilineae bacterium]